MLKLSTTVYVRHGLWDRLGGIFLLRTMHFSVLPCIYRPGFIDTVQKVHWTNKNVLCNLNKAMPCAFWPSLLLWLNLARVRLALDINNISEIWDLAFLRSKEYEDPVFLSTGLYGKWKETAYWQNHMLKLEGQVLSQSAKKYTWSIRNCQRFNNLFWRGI